MNHVKNGKIGLDRDPSSPFPLSSLLLYFVLPAKLFPPPPLCGDNVPAESAGNQQVQKAGRVTQAHRMATPLKLDEGGVVRWSDGKSSWIGDRPVHLYALCHLHFSVTVAIRAPTY